LAAFAQSSNRPSETKQQQRNADSARLKAQRRYDPPGGQKQIIRGGPLEGLLDSINQQDIDYGTKLADARQIFLGGTFENLYFWIIVAEGVTVLILVLYVFWLFRERGNRLEISVNIVTQLANSYLYTRSRAIDAIRRHNQLVDNYNVMAEEQTKQNLAEQAAATSVVPASAGEQATEIPTQGESPLPEPELTSNSKSNSAEQMTTQDAPPDQVKMTKQQYKALIEETKRSATRGSAQQVAALNQQVRNLREQLNMALTRIEKYEKQDRSSVRA
jgi:FtsZ-interacting cell division protein ZipA